jgi:hypothetical protein
MSDKFDVYLSAMGLPETKENVMPLSGFDALQLARRCTERVAITKVTIVCCRDDTICFHWEDGKVLFP